jgi:hypothetical protein
MPLASCPNCRTNIIQEPIIRNCINWGIYNNKLYEALEVQLPFSLLTIREQGILHFEYNIELNKIINFSLFNDIKNNIQQRNDNITNIFNDLCSKKQYSIVYFSKPPKLDFFTGMFHYYIFI